MASFSGLGIGLSFVFGCIFLGLVAELYYVWYKKKNQIRGIEDHRYTKYIKFLSKILCLHEKPTSEINPKSQSQIPISTINTYPDSDELADPELGFPKMGIGEEGLDTELIRTHNLCGPPRFLFTINEETKEDLESDDGKSRGDRSRKGSRSKSLSDFLNFNETPVLTPLASPRVNQNGFNFNPLFSGLSEAEVNRALNSPPPKFKFLRDAEEKFAKRKFLIQETEKKSEKQSNSIGSKVLPLGPSRLSIGST